MICKLINRFNINYHKRYISSKLTLKDFINNNYVVNDSINDNINDNQNINNHFIHPITLLPLQFYIETYGCQMNSSDSNIVRTILITNGMKESNDLTTADIILTNTCAIRENAEIKVYNRLEFFHSFRNKQKLLIKKQNRHVSLPIIGVLGCMAERLKEELLNVRSVDFICGPDAYRDIPNLISNILSTNNKQSNIQLSIYETYSDIIPTANEINSNISAYVSIMRGCNNMCSFCIVPFTRGRERSRPLDSIINEIEQLVKSGVREVVLLGQNVNGYHDITEESLAKYPNSLYSTFDGFNNLYKGKDRYLPGARFVDLLSEISKISPELRIRFTSPHPKDFPTNLIDLIASTPNICKSIHLPLQSGNNNVLSRMRRGYTAESYLELVDYIRSKIPHVSLSTDVITGFCGETPDEHRDTVDMMDKVKFDMAYMYAYSLRAKTHAACRVSMEDDVSEDVKIKRLQEVINKYQSTLYTNNKINEVNQYRLVLVEELAKKQPTNFPSVTLLTGRTDSNKRVVFPLTSVLLNSFRSYHNNEITVDYNINSDNYKDHDEIIEMSIKYENHVKNNSTNDDLLLINNHNDILGKYVMIKILKANGPTLRGIIISQSSISECTDLGIIM